MTFWVLLQVISDTQELVSSKVAGAKEAMAKVVHDGKELMVETRMGKMALRGAEAFLEKSEELLDHYLPVTDEELGKNTRQTLIWHGRIAGFGAVSCV